MLAKNASSKTLKLLLTFLLATCTNMATEIMAIVDIEDTTNTVEVMAAGGV